MRLFDSADIHKCSKMVAARNSKLGQRPLAINIPLPQRNIHQAPVDPRWFFMVLRGLLALACTDRHTYHKVSSRIYQVDLVHRTAISSSDQVSIPSVLGYDEV